MEFVSLLGMQGVNKLVNCICFILQPLFMQQRYVSFLGIDAIWTLVYESCN